jgi:HlyD family secretion protein
VRKGQVLAEVENADLRAALAQTQAVVARRQAELDKLNNGARAEEREKAAAQLAAARALEDRAHRNLARKAPLAATGIESRSTLDQAVAGAAEAEAQRQAMNAQRALIEAAPRPEDVRIAEAELAEAQANVAVIQAQIDKTIILSPIDGVVLSRQKHAGEAVTNLPPTVIVHVGDVSRLRVRADVDEADVADIAVGQHASVTADAYPGQRFGGSIVRVGSALGRKNFRTERATEKVDTKVLETLIELDPDVHLPVGLRVDVWIDAAKTASRPPQSNVGVSDASSPPSSTEPSQARLQPVEASRPSQPDASAAAPLAPLETAVETSPASDSDRADSTRAEAPPVAIAPPQPTASLGSEQNAPVAEASPAVPAKDVATSADRARIVLRAVDDSWVQVHDGQGKAIFTRGMKVGDSYTVPNQPGLTLTSGNSGGLDIVVDGVIIPRLGKSGHVVRDVSLDPDRLESKQAASN